MQRLQSATNFESLTARAAQLVAAGRVGAARPLLAAARRLAPNSTALADLSARLALRANTPDTAIAELDTAITAAPDDPSLRKRRAELRRQAGDIEGAARDAAEAVVLDRTAPDAKALLGVLVLELGRTTDAIACLAEAVAAEPANPGFAAGLAAAHEAAGDPDAALAVLLRNIALAPNLVAQRNAAILLCARRRDFRQAVRLAAETSRAGIADACCFGLLGHALSSLGRHSEATEAYSEALKLGPDDPYVRHLVAAAGILPSASRAPVEYLRAVFDGYAERFEPHLLTLRYRAPGLFRAAVQCHPRVAGGEPVGPVLDLGCGTGLVGLMIADLPVGPMIGVDIAPKMLAQARAKGIYAELHEGDIVDFLKLLPLASDKPVLSAGAGCDANRSEGPSDAFEGDQVGNPPAVAGSQAVHPPPPWRGDLGSNLDQAQRCKATAVLYPLILAADVFCYFGALEELLAAVHAALRFEGWLICSVEELLADHDGFTAGNGQWALQRQGRYAHSLAYVSAAAAAAGFHMLRCDRQILRYEAGAPVKGLLLVLKRGAA